MFLPIVTSILVFIIIAYKKREIFETATYPYTKKVMLICCSLSFSLVIISETDMRWNELIVILKVATAIYFIKFLNGIFVSLQQVNIQDDLLDESKSSIEANNEKEKS